jgi:hypothetical protein
MSSRISEILVHSEADLSCVHGVLYKGVLFWPCLVLPSAQLILVLNIPDTLWQIIFMPAAVTTKVNISAWTRTRPLLVLVLDLIKEEYIHPNMSVGGYRVHRSCLIGKLLVPFAPVYLRLGLLTYSGARSHAPQQTLP